MGILFSKSNSNKTIDFGKTKTQGLYTTNLDYDFDIASKYVKKGRLAPFYKGSVDPITDKKPNYTFECPICFLYYPSQMNKTQCCDNSICTDCFLQLRRPSNTPLVPAVCPFCVQPNLGVLYIPPSWSKFYNDFKKRRGDLFSIKGGDRRKWKLSSDDPDVVLVDHTRPNWMNMVERSSFGTTRRTRIRINHPNTNNNTNMQQRRGRRRRPYQQHQNYPSSILTSSSSSSSFSFHRTIYDTNATLDLEDILVMEAIRLSLAQENTNTRSSS